ncbi:MAG TPA: N-acetyltransferase [Vicinamibacteria bacterium]|nr:N-acetyltransferase [Vicinamibacteria bacterium]
MSTVAPRPSVASLQVADLRSLPSTELERFWKLEIAIWREQLEWDVSAAVASLRQAFERGSLRGKAVRIGARTSAFGYYLVEGDRAVVSGLGVVPDERPMDGWSRGDLAHMLLSSLLGELRARRIRRIESQLITPDASWLVSSFQREGFRLHWRDFHRLPLERFRVVAAQGDGAPCLQLFRAWNLSEASDLMQGAHRGGVDAEMNELYRTNCGCRKLLNNILRQRGCGAAIVEASAMARHRVSDRAMGFCLVTETARHKAHLAQLAVAPDFQRRGVGRALIGHAAARLSSLGYETLSLMVSSGNAAAAELYRSVGFEPAFRFPVFSWERA